AFTRILDGEDVPPMLFNIDGAAGCGKTYLISTICWKLRTMAAERGVPDPIRVFAPSGVAALNINGQTLHSASRLPIGGGFEPLTGQRLAAFQNEFEGVHFIIIDDKSMMRSSHSRASRFPPAPDPAVR
ncbi:hypothetical protein EV714DRAFT_221874, partial [Schizophyllum commune]